MESETHRTTQWKPLQDGLAKATGLSLLAYGPSRSVDLSRTVCEPSQDNPICRLLQEQYGQRAQCDAHCGRQVARAFETGRGAAFTCHANLRAFTAPVTDEQGVSLVILGGKSFSSYEDFFLFRETAQRYGVDAATLLTVAKDIHFKDVAFVESAAGLVEEIARGVLRSLASRQRQEASSARLMTLFAISAELRNQLDQPSLFRLALSTIGVLFNANSAMILDVEARGDRYSAVESFGVKREALSRYSAPRHQKLLAQIQPSHRHVASHAASELGQAGFPPDVTSAHVFSLAQDGRRLLVVLDTAFADDDVKVLSAFCDLFAVILENANLRAQVADRRQGLASLTELMRNSASTLSVADLSQIVLDCTTASVDAEQGSLMLLDEDRNELVVKAIKGLNPKIVDALRIRPGEGISGSVFAEGQPLLVSDLETDARVLQDKRPRYRTRSFVSLPLRAEDRTIGVLNVADKASGDPFTSQDLDLLTSIATYTMVAVQRSEFHRRSEELKRISITDSLTGLLNRGHFQERLSEEVERFKRHKLPFSLIMIDIDDFKRLNDTHGHVVGDEALVATARAIRNSIRAIDMAARYGGEEFTVILPQTSKQASRTMAQRIGRAVSRTPIHSTKGDVMHLTVSLGAASFPDDASTPDELLQRADQAMYEAKRRGKNQAVVYEPPGAPPKK
ncbi:MAG: diguanylate cyclase [Nitrospirota bacterium]